MPTKKSVKNSVSKSVVKKSKVAKAKTSVKKTKAVKSTPVKKVVQKAGERKVRSFKVLLPGNEEYSGRFTGLTPYQAANKALSKYYREVKNPKSGIRFSIRESTRGSKRGTYTYSGSREKLETPITYEIDGGRVITKNFKNRLTKVKKAELEKLMQEQQVEVSKPKAKAKGKVTKSKKSKSKSKSA